MLFLALVAGRVSGYPISPQTLRKLVERSSFIVIARIDNPYANDTIYDGTIMESVIGFSGGGDGVADLSVIEVLKGNPDSLKHLQVGYQPGMICPEPPHYPDKETVIAFLRRCDTCTLFETVALSYGTKVMKSEAELNAYVHAIDDYLEILKIRNRHKRKRATIEWLVKCAENKYTRWEGAYELSRKKDFMSYYDRSKDERLYRKLTKSQKRRLEAAFFAADTIGVIDLMLIGFVSQSNSGKLKQYLLNNLPFASFYMGLEIMELILEIDENGEMQELYRLAERLKADDDESVSQQKAIIDKFILLTAGKKV